MARTILEDILAQYAEYGPAQIVLPQRLQLLRVPTAGDPQEITALFSGATQTRVVVMEFQTLMYAV